MKDNIPVMYGRFQPFTEEDLRNLKKLRSEYGVPVVMIYIRSHQGYANTPFKSATVKKMLSLVKESYPGLVETVVSSDDWDTSDILHKLGIRTGFAMESDHNSVKAALARLSLTMGAEDEFNRCTPECIHGMYEELRSEIKTYQK